jgi:hypothetical protein
MSENNTNLMRSANQARIIGSVNPPNMSRTSDKMLKAASPIGMDLLNTTKTNKDSSDAAAAKCRTYKDITGLRQLMKDQVNKTHYDPGCGWRYKPSTGLYPEINQGALGTESGPSIGMAGSIDEVSGGTQWFWNLEDAEKKITAKICQNASKCKQLSLMGRYADICGYCKSTGAIIPVVNGAARYRKDGALGCAKKDIVTAATGGCPAEEGFQSLGRPVQGNLQDAFTVREGFGSLDSLNNCMDMPLSRDCVIKVAQNAGCSDEGTLIQALKANKSGNYDSQLKANQAYQSYTSFSPLTNGLLQDGSVASINTALTDFGKIMGNTQSQNQKLALSARDLCVRAGEFDNYDFCSEMRADTIINSGNIKCIQRMWLQNGGTAQGSENPTLEKWNGKRFDSFLTPSIGTLMDTNSDDKNKNVTALRKLIGTESSSNKMGRAGVDLPMDENTRGAETVWFDLSHAYDENVPLVVLRCDLGLLKEKNHPYMRGESMPYITTWTDLTNKYRFWDANNKAYTSAFELRTPNDRAVFNVVTDDGFMISKNQNPFENAGGGPDWGSWQYQGPTSYTSAEYNINEGQPNVFVTKWYQGYGEATSKFNINRLATGWMRGADSPDVYLTQEPLAPWMQYELCARPNNGRGASVGFFEKRWNGMSAKTPSGAARPSFDVNVGSVVFQTDPLLRKEVPGQKGYMSFVSNSYWHTRAYFHFNAFRTLTLLIRPKATLANGGMASIFHQCNFRGYSAGMYLVNDGKYQLTYGTSKGQFGKRVDVTMNEWNLIVIQYVGDENGIRTMTINVERLSTLQKDSGRRNFMNILSAGRNGVGSVVIGNYALNYVENSGQLIMGAWNNRIYPTAPSSAGAQSFTGDVAWIHGFRNYLDTDQVLRNEIEQGWISRWPIKNLPNDKVQTYSYQGCYRDAPNRALPVSLNNVKSVEECANISKARGFNTFGLQYYGQCWAGNNTDWDRYGRLNDAGCGELGSDWNNQVYVHNSDPVLNLPEQDVYGNNGTVSCQRYCGGINGVPWGGELPKSWNGAKCVNSPSHPGVSCGKEPGFMSGFVCRCQRTGSGWTQGGL